MPIASHLVPGGSVPIKRIFGGMLHGVVVLLAFCQLDKLDIPEKRKIVTEKMPA